MLGYNRACMPDSDFPEAQPPLPELDLQVRTSDQPSWNGWDVLLLAMAFVFASVAGGVIAAVVAHARGVPAAVIAYDARLVVPVQIGAYLVVLALMYVLITRAHRVRFWQGVRWRWPDTGANALGLLLLGMVMCLALEYLQALLPKLKSVPMDKFFRDPTSAYLLGAVAIVAAPLMEELFFRGFLYPVLRRLGAAVAVLATSAAFAVVHGTQYGWAWQAMLVMFLVGMVLTVARARSGSVAVSFLMHAGYNLMLFIMLFITTDRFRHLERMT